MRLNVGDSQAEFGTRTRTLELTGQSAGSRVFPGNVRECELQPAFITRQRVLELFIAPEGWS